MIAMYRYKLELGNTLRELGGASRALGLEGTKRSCRRTRALGPERPGGKIRQECGSPFPVAVRAGAAPQRPRWH